MYRHKRPRIEDAEDVEDTNMSHDDDNDDDHEYDNSDDEQSSLEMVTIKLPIGSAERLVKTNPVFKAFFPIAELRSELQYSEWVDATVTLTVNTITGKYHGPATMTGFERIELETDEYGNVLPDEDQPTSGPEQFTVEANFANGKLHGNFVVYSNSGHKLFSIKQVLYDRGKIAAILTINNDSVYLEFNSIVVQAYSYDTEVDIYDFLAKNPNFEPNVTSWETKLALASTLCTRFTINSD